jgi:hypothetical protein
VELGNLSLELHNLATSSASDVLMCISRSLKDSGFPGGLATLAVVCLERFESPECGEKKQEDPGDVESDRRENELRTETTRFDETTCVVPPTGTAGARIASTSVPTLLFANGPFRPSESG